MERGVGAQGALQSSAPVTPQTQSAGSAQVRVEAHALEEEDENLTIAERESVERMLTELYGIPWVVGAQELRLENEECEDQTVTEPELL